MKWLLTFLLGVITGAVGLGAYLRDVAPSEAPRQVQAPVAPVTPPTVVVIPAPVAPAPPAPTASAEIAQPAPPEAVVAPTAPSMPNTSAASALLVPVAGVSAAQLNDTYNQARGSERRHEALDILAPKGTEVFAVADGRLTKLFNSKPGGITLYQFDMSEKYAYYYAHLDRYADGIKEGMMLKRGDLVGYVGYTGNADQAAPHLHFAVFELGPEKQWWKGTPLNPYPLLGGGKRPS